MFADGLTSDSGNGEKWDFPAIPDDGDERRLPTRADHPGFTGAVAVNEQPWQLLTFVFSARFGSERPGYRSHNRSVLTLASCGRTAGCAAASSLLRVRLLALEGQDNRLSPERTDQMAIFGFRHAIAVAGQFFELVAVPDNDTAALGSDHACALQNM